MKEILSKLPKTKDLQGIDNQLFQCSNGCLLSPEMLIVITYRKGSVIRCPYCNSDNIKQVV